MPVSPDIASAKREFRESLLRNKEIDAQMSAAQSLENVCKTMEELSECLNQEHLARLKAEEAAEHSAKFANRVAFAAAFGTILQAACALFPYIRSFVSWLLKFMVLQ